MIGGISFSATSITSGLDIDKPATPKPGSQYLATDTKKQYNCFVAGTWVDNSKVTSGVYASRPINPVVGDIFISTPDSTIYYCYLNGVWSQISTVNNIEIVGVANTDKLVVSDDTNYSLPPLPTWKEIDIFVPQVITKADVRVSWQAGYDGQGRNIGSVIKINDVQLGPVKNTDNDWTTYTEDVTVYGGDKITLWAVYTDNLNPGGNVRNFRIYTELKYRHTLKSIGSDTGWVFDVDNV